MASDLHIKDDVSAKIIMMWLQRSRFSDTIIEIRMPIEQHRWRQARNAGGGGGASTVQVPTVSETRKA